MKLNKLFSLHHNKVMNHVNRIMFRSCGSKTNILNENFSLSKHVHAKIKACGPITVAEYMKEALTHPIAGYYMRKDVFGVEGDFITSPEISQLFGEMLGVWVLSEWRKVTNQESQLVELGPGRGTLSKDILKVFKQFKAADKLSIHFVEVSLALASIQANKMCVTSQDVSPVRTGNSVGYYKEGLTEEGVKVFWYYAIEDVPKKFSIFIAHEFFDALPIHKFQKSNGVWHEVFVDIDPSSDDKFRYVLSRTPTLTSKLFIAENETREHVELSLQSLTTVDYLSSFLQENGGFALIADYGHSGENTDTFRAFRKHKQQDPLVNPGAADLTADVDFSMLKRTATKDNKSIVFGPVTQSQFLKQLGIDVRLDILSKNIPDAAKEELRSQYHMIMDNNKMGKCFKMLALYPSILKDHLRMWPVTGFLDETNTHPRTLQDNK